MLILSRDPGIGSPAHAVLKLQKGFETLLDEEDCAKIQGFGWYAKKHGRTSYVMANVHKGGKRTSVFLHRVLLCPQPHEHVDHINGDGLDNRRCNLRIVTHSQNHCNRVNKIEGRSASYRGVDWHQKTQKYRARITLHGKTTCLGMFDCEEEAARAYDEAGFLRDPVHFTPNFPKGNK